MKRWFMLGIIGAIVFVPVAWTDISPRMELGQSVPPREHFDWQNSPFLPKLPGDIYWPSNPADVREDIHWHK